MDIPLAEELGKAFEARYPGIKVLVKRSGAERIFERIAEERNLGLRARDNGLPTSMGPHDVKPQGRLPDLKI